MEFTVVLLFDDETENKYRYKEQRPAVGWPLIGRFYVSKETVVGTPPARIEVTVRGL